MSLNLVSRCGDVIFGNINRKFQKVGEIKSFLHTKIALIRCRATLAHSGESLFEKLCQLRTLEICGRSFFQLPLCQPHFDYLYICSCIIM